MRKPRTSERCAVRVPGTLRLAIATAGVLMLASSLAHAGTPPAISVTTGRGCGNQAVYAPGEYLDFCVELLEVIDQPSVTVQFSITMANGQHFAGSTSLSNQMPQRCFSGSRETFPVPPFDGMGRIEAHVATPTGPGPTVTCEFVASAEPTPTPGTPTATHAPATTPTASATTITIITPTPTASATSPLPTAGTTATATATPARGDGDANCDGRLSSADLVRYQELIAIQARAVCRRDDLTGDDAVTSADLEALIPVLFNA